MIVAVVFGGVSPPAFAEDNTVIIAIGDVSNPQSWWLLCTQNIWELLHTCRSVRFPVCVDPVRFAIHSCL